MSILQRLQVFARESAIKGHSSYTWYRYKGKPRKLTSSRGYSVNLQKGHRIGLRPAKTAPDKMRLIHEHTGKTKVFSLSHNVAGRLIRNSTLVGN